MPPATSKSQQAAAGIALGMKRGEIPLEDIPIEIEQLKATIKLKKKAIAEIEEKEG